MIDMQLYFVRKIRINNFQLVVELSTTFSFKSYKIMIIYYHTFKRVLFWIKS